MIGVKAFCSKPRHDCKNIALEDKTANTVKPVLRDDMKQDIGLAFQTGGCLLLHESSAESSTLLSFSNKQPPVVISMSPE